MSVAEKEFDATMARRRRGVVNLAELAVALLWELAREWDLRPRRIVHARGVRWLGASDDGGGIRSSQGWSRLYEQKNVRVTSKG